MNSTGKTNLEYLIPLMERGIPVVDYLAENFEKSKEEVYDMVSEGLIPGAEAARIIADAMGDDFGGSLKKQSQTYSGLMSTLSDAREQLDAAMGEGYNEARKPAIQEEIDYLSGEGGEQMKEMYSLIGEFQASLENEKEKAIRDAMTSVMDTDEYEAAELAGDGAKMGELLAQAKAEAEKAYMETSAYQTMIDSQTSTLEKVRNTMADSYWQAGYDLAEEFNKGIAAAFNSSDGVADTATEKANSFLWGVMGIQGETRFLVDILKDSVNASRSANGYASGLMYVPYDDYPARLHEGERVLTAREARSYGGGVTVSVTGNNFTVREEADIDQIAETIAQRVTEAKELAAW